VGTKVPQRVTLLHWGERPRTTMLALVVEERQLNVFSTPAELANGGPPADMVVVDVPAQYRRVVCAQVRRHYHGRLLVLLDPEDSSHDLPPDANRTLLTRPFGIYELSAALAGPAPIQPAGDPRLVVPRRAQDRGGDSSPGTGRSVVAEVVPWLAQFWRERRLVRLSTISVTVALLFMVAFALVTQGTGCGSACDELTGPDLTSSSRATFTAVAAGPVTTDSSAAPVADATSRADAPTSRKPGIAKTTAGPSGALSPTSPPDPTRPPSTAPPTTAPPTTAPPTTAPPTTAPPTTAPPTTAPPTTAPPTSTATTTTAPPHPTPPPHPTQP
jgi:hypothetical protein